MKMNTYSVRSLCCSLMLLSASVGADYSCKYDLRLGVVTGNDQVRVLSSSRTLFQINQSEHLFIGGRHQSLSPEQQQAVTLYADGIYAVVPEITLLAKEGVSLVTDNITRIYSGLIGQDNDSLDDLYGSMKKVKYRVKEKFGHAGEYYFIDPGQLEAVDDIENSLEAKIESGFSNVGGILTAIGTFDASEDSENSQDEFILRKRARYTCKKLHKLDKVEAQLHALIPKLKKLELITDRTQSEQTN